MINKKISTMVLVILLATFSFEAWAGPLVWGPISLQANNTIEVEVRGKPESYITAEIRKAELNETVANKDGSMNGTNMKDIIHITWGYTEGAREYVIYKAYSLNGPWIELTRFSEDQHKNAVDGTSEAEARDLCYKIEALDRKGKVIKRYAPVCIPKWQTEESALPLTMGMLSNTGVEPAIAGSTQSSSASYVGDVNLNPPSRK